MRISEGEKEESSRCARNECGVGVERGDVLACLLAGLLLAEQREALGFLCAPSAADTTFRHVDRRSRSGTAGQGWLKPGMEMRSKCDIFHHHCTLHTDCIKTILVEYEGRCLTAQHVLRRSLVIRYLSLSLSMCLGIRSEPKIGAPLRRDSRPWIDLQRAPRAAIGICLQAISVHLRAIKHSQASLATVDPCGDRERPDDDAQGPARTLRAEIAGRNRGK